MLEHERPALLAALLETAVDAIIVIDREGIIESVNPATERMFGFSQTEMRGQNVKMLMPQPYRNHHNSYLKRYHQTGEARIIGIGREVIGKRKDGSTFPVHLAVSEVDAGERTLFAGIIRDISDLKAVEKELMQLNATLDQRVQEQAAELNEAHVELLEKEKFATLGRISGGIAHEIRNPLNAIKTSAYYLLNAKSPSPEKQREHLMRIDRQVTIIDSAVTALSDLARLPEPKKNRCDLAALMAEVCSTIRLPGNITVELRFDPDLPPAVADQKQLPIVFKNLVRNARDAMPDGGRLVLSAETEYDQVIVRVQDTGTGITPDVLRRIDEPFFSTKARGMGLGIAITKAILEKNHGSMRVETKVGQGTTFFVALPTSGELT